MTTDDEKRDDESFVDYMERVRRKKLLHNPDPKQPPAPSAAPAPNPMREPSWAWTPKPKRVIERPITVDDDED